MIATCVINGWPTDNYTDASHSLQVAIKDEIEKLAREKVQFTTSDGCGAPLFAFSIAGLAQAIHTMTISNDPVYQEVMNAQRQFPEMVGGIGRLNTRQMQAVDGLFMKDGAEAFMVATYKNGHSVAFKISDGSPRAFATILYRILESWGIKADAKAPYVKVKRVIDTFTEKEIYQFQMITTMEENPMDSKPTKPKTK